MFLSIPFIGIIWSCTICKWYPTCSWAFHLLVLFDRAVIDMADNASSWAFHLLVLFDQWYIWVHLQHRSWAFHLLVLFDLEKQNKLFSEGSWAFHLLVLFDPNRCCQAVIWVLEHSIYWYYLIVRAVYMLRRAFLSIPFIGIIWSPKSDNNMSDVFLSIPFIGIIWSINVVTLNRKMFLSIPFIGIIWSN